MLGGALVGVLRAAGIPARLERQKDFPIHSSVRIHLGEETPEVNFYDDHFSISTKGIEWIMSDNGYNVYHQRGEWGSQDFPDNETELEKVIEKHIDEKGLLEKDM